MRLRIFQHVPFEGAGFLGQWAQARGWEFEKTRFYQPGAVIPSVDDYDWLVIMGGPMGVHDEAQFPWLAAEKDAIRHAINAGKPVLGICLGAQLIAHVLGAEVRKHTHPEIGFFPIGWTCEALAHPLCAGLNEAQDVYHWHGDTFAIPEGAVHLARSEACANQGFLYKNHVLGLQFHLEVTQESATAILNACGHELKPDRWVQPGEVITRQLHKLPACQFTLDRLLRNWFALNGCIPPEA